VAEISVGGSELFALPQQTLESLMGCVMQSFVVPSESGSYARWGRYSHAVLMWGLAVKSRSRGLLHRDI
jgi:hypothetical protein